MKHFLKYLAILLLVAFSVSLLRCKKAEKKVVSAPEPDSFPVCMLSDSARLVEYQTRRYYGMFDSLSGMMGEAKWLAFNRETSFLAQPYANDEVQAGVRYLGKYAFSYDAICTAYKELGWGAVSEKDLVSFKESPKEQEICMDALLDYFTKELIKLGISPTAKLLSTAHWKGLNGALAIRKGGGE